MTDRKTDEFTYLDEEEDTALTPIREEEEDERVVEVTEVREEKNSGKAFMVGMAALVCLVGGALWMFFGRTSFPTEDANKVIEAHENYPMKAEKLDPTKAYTLSGASDSLNNGTISIEKIQFRRDGTRLWVKFVNRGSQKINMMPGANSTLVDNNGHSYKSDPFASNQINGIAPGATEEVMLVYEPIREDAKQITFHMDMIFDMKNAAWQVAIPVELP